MPERPAVNASPLIFLARGKRLDLLQAAGEEIVVPADVAREVRQRGPSDPTAQALATTPWLMVVESGEVPSLIQTWDLGPGESAVLSWGYANPGTEIIVDDRAARRCAKALGVPARGTLGLVLAAKRNGVIAAARPVLNDLRQSGMYLSGHVLDQALALEDE